MILASEAVRGPDKGKWMGGWRNIGHVSVKRVLFSVMEVVRMLRESSTFAYN